MAVLRKLVSGIKALLHRQRTEQEMDEELTDYFDELIAAKLRKASHLKKRGAQRVYRWETWKASSTRSAPWDGNSPWIPSFVIYATVCV